MSRSELVLSVELCVPAVLLTLFADAMFWDLTPVLLALGAWAFAGAGWLIIAFRPRPGGGASTKPAVFAIAVLSFAGSLTVASTDWAPRAALSLSRAELESLAASAPQDGSGTDVLAGLYRITSVSRDEDGVHLDLGLLGEEPGFVLGWLDLAGFVLGNDCDLTLMDDAQSEKFFSGWGASANHLSGDWYSVCYAFPD